MAELSFCKSKRAGHVYAARAHSTGARTLAGGAAPSPDRVQIRRPESACPAVNPGSAMAMIRRGPGINLWSFNRRQFTLNVNNGKAAAPEVAARARTGVNAGRTRGSAARRSRPQVTGARGRFQFAAGLARRCIRHAGVRARYFGCGRTLVVRPPPITSEVGYGTSALLSLSLSPGAIYTCLHKAREKPVSRDTHGTIVRMS